MKLFKNLISSSSICLFFLSFIACQSNTLCEEELIKYYTQEKNGLSKSTIVNEVLKVSCMFKSPDLLFKKDSSFLNGIKDQFWWFKLSVEYIGNRDSEFSAVSKVLNEQVTNSSQWFSATNNTDLQISNVQPISYFDATSKIDYLITIKKNESLEEEVTISFSPPALSFLESEFEFNKKTLDNVPSLKLDC